MKTQPESVNVSTAIRTVRDDIRKSNPHRLTIHDLRDRDVFVIPARSTR
jgi:hypothetical protein